MMIRYEIYRHNSVKNEVFNKHPGELHNRGYLKQALIYFINHDREAPQGAY